MDSEGEGAVQEDLVFQDWLKQSGDHASVFYALKEIWRELDDVGSVLSETTRTGKDNYAPVPPSKIYKYFGTDHIQQWGLIAAMVCLVFTASYSTGYFDAFMADETTSTGEIRQVILEDGSHIRLNSNSALNIEMTRFERRITLIKGEASFDVAKDPTRPFVVYAGTGQAKALGTIYMVRLRDEGAVVSVIESQVEVGVGRTRKMLHAAERVMIGTDRRLGQVETIDIIRATAWERGKIIFENTPLSEVIAEINTHFSGYIRLSNPEIRDIQVNGVFELSDPLALVELLEESLNLKSTRLTDHLIFLH
ncbi:MAG: FecR domain-containing protein [Emcibacter sp.]|nr:FecR domain-containing protein [Emcibacter sp.]